MINQINRNIDDLEVDIMLEDELDCFQSNENNFSSIIKKSYTRIINKVQFLKKQNTGVSSCPCF